MNIQYQKEIQQLRQHIPIGLKYGLMLLEKTHGNIEEAEKVFQQECIHTIIEKKNITEEEAIRNLIKSNYNIPLALENVDAERYTISERIIKRHKDKEEALGKIAFTIEEKESLVRNFWLDFTLLDKLESEVFCVIVVMEWLSYEGYEGFASALYFHTDIIIDTIQNKLLLPEFAEIIKKAKEIDEANSENQTHKISTQGFVQPVPEFTEQRNIYNTWRSILIDRLFNLVIKNIAKFP